MSEVDEGKYFEKLNNLDLDIELEGGFIDKEHKHLLIRARGYIDAFNSRDFGKAITSTLELVGPEIVVIDLQSINYIASMGFGELTSIYKFTMSKDIKLKLLNINPKVYDVLALLGFAGFFDIINDISRYNEKESTLFPINIKCPHCSIALKIPKAGKFKCKGCKNTFRVNNEGDIENED